MKTRLKCTLSVAGLGLWISICSTPACADVVYVTKYGSFAPPVQLGLDHGQFRMIETAVCAQIEPGGTIEVGPGTYRETFTIDKPVSLIAPNGPFTVGDLTNDGETSLKVVTYNTHLFGDDDIYSGFWRSLLGDFADVVLDLTDFDEWIDDQIDRLGNWQDQARATEIVKAIAIPVPGPDVIVLQEVWDSSLAQILIDGFHDYGYTHSFYGDARDSVLGISDPQHSGLLLLSKFPLEGASQTIYDDEENLDTCLGHLGHLATGCWDDCFLPPWDCVGCISGIVSDMKRDCVLTDGFASKSFITARIVKDGFPILIYGTHTQASGLPPGRPEQLQQLAESVSVRRRADPGAAIVVTGDFNERGEGVVTGTPPDLVYSNEATDGYKEVLGPLGELGGVHDAARNAPTPCFMTDTGAHMTVDPIWNSLDVYFWPDNAGHVDKIKRLDYFFADGDMNGDIELLFEGVEMKKYMAENDISGGGSNGDHTDRNLSDHYGLLAKFKLYRVPD